MPFKNTYTTYHGKAIINTHHGCKTSLLSTVYLLFHTFCPNPNMLHQRKIQTNPISTEIYISCVLQRCVMCWHLCKSIHKRKFKAEFVWTLLLASIYTKSPDNQIFDCQYTLAHKPLNLCYNLGFRTVDLHNIAPYVAYVAPDCSQGKLIVFYLIFVPLAQGRHILAPTNLNHPGWTKTSNGSLLFTVS